MCVVMSNNASAPKLCESCHIRAATVHLTEPGLDEEVRHRDLCEECFTFETKWEAELKKAALGAFGHKPPNDNDAT